MREMTAMNDLLGRISKGDQDAFRLFFDSQYPKVNRFVSYLIRKGEVKEEVISDVFLSVWQQREKMTVIVNLDAYLYTLTRNKALDYIRQSAIPVAVEQLSVGFISGDGSPEDNLMNKELDEKIRESIESLPEKCKLVFLMAKEQGLKYREIAEILQISEKTVNAQMVIALKKMNTALHTYLKSILFSLTIVPL